MLIPTALRIASHPVSRDERVARATETARGRSLGDSTGQEQQEGSLANLFSHVDAGSGRAAVLRLGSRARDLAREGNAASDPSPAELDATEDQSESAAGVPSSATSVSGEELSEEERQTVEQLEQRDREVRTHEQAHKAAGGAYAGSIHLDYEVGPDGKRYASSGSVPIDVTPVAGDPTATLRKMEVVRRAALAPADPSGADRSVAAKASQQAQRARAEMAAERYASTQRLVTESEVSTESQPASAAEAASPAPSRSFGRNVLRYQQAQSAAPSSHASLFSHVG